MLQACFLAAIPSATCYNETEEVRDSTVMPTDRTLAYFDKRMNFGSKTKIHIISALSIHFIPKQICYSQWGLFIVHTTREQKVGCGAEHSSLSRPEVPLKQLMVKVEYIIIWCTYDLEAWTHFLKCFTQVLQASWSFCTMPSVIFFYY